MIDQKCPKCDSQMVAGFLLEKNTPRTSPEVEITPTEWVAIERDYFEEHGKFQESHIIERIAVETFRCLECGFIEFYAKAPLGE